MTDQIPAKSPSAVMHCDVERYAEHLAEFDLTDEQANALLSALWNIMVHFVELGFEIDTLPQDHQESCGLQGNGGLQSERPPLEMLTLEEGRKPQ